MLHFPAYRRRSRQRSAILTLLGQHNRLSKFSIEALWPLTSKDEEEKELQPSSPNFPHRHQTCWYVPRETNWSKCPRVPRPWAWARRHGACDIRYISLKLACRNYFSRRLGSLGCLLSMGAIRGLSKEIINPLNPAPIDVWITSLIWARKAEETIGNLGYIFLPYVEVGCTQ